MQLNNRNVKSALFAASCTLLTGNAIAESWDAEAALMIYSETDRVKAVEGIVNAKKTFSDDSQVSVKLVFDSLTGASASGAVPQQSAQTFTSPSGNNSYDVNARETPLDPTFKDTRVQASGQWTQPFGENYVLSGGGNFSKEYDYQSIGVNGVISRYLNLKNTTVSLGVSFASDSINPVGDSPVGLSTMVLRSDFPANESGFRAAFDATRDSDSESKDTLDLVLGLTQVINRQWITQFNIGFSDVSGYLTDPYKVVSSVDDNGVSQKQLYELRPDTRTKQSFYAQSKYHFEKSVLDLSYRFNSDDWGIQSHTLETRYRFLFSNNSYLEPHIRLYQQGEADFYRPFLLEGEALPEYASADYRIGKLNAYTVGLKYGRKLNNGHEYGVRLEYYSQASQDVGVNAPGQLSNLDLNPTLNALILQFDYKL